MSRWLALGQALVAPAAGYHAVMAAAAWAARGSQQHHTRPVVGRPVHKFCIVVPAHDEATGIASTLASLAELDYPSEMVRVHVVADHCIDDTAGVVRGCGVEAHEHDDPLRPGKGPALEWLLARLVARGEPFDAVVFVDADSVLDPGFLRIVDARLADGALVVQSYYAVRDPDTSSTVALRAVALAARHYLRPLGRARLGCSAGLFGNGMVFRREVLAQHSWSDHLTEDIELHLELLLHDVPVTFAPDAVVFGEMPATLEAAISQNERWERGRLDTARRYVPALLRRTVGGGPLGRLTYVDAAVDQAVPPLSVVVLAQAGVTAVALGHLAWRPSRSSWSGVLIALACSAVHTAYVLSAVQMTRVPGSAYRAMLGAPGMAIWKLRLWCRMLVPTREVGWVRTGRNEVRPR